jgi:uncharacterized protein (TIGR01777 family)
MQIFVTGGTGLLGRRLVRQLQARGDQPIVLTRRYGPARQTLGPDFKLIEGDPMRPGPWQQDAAECDAVINLAGENIFNHRWNDMFKGLITASRLNATRLVVEALGRKPRRADGRPKVLVNASAIGIYGPHGDEELTEDSPPGSDFLAGLSVEWEKAARAVEATGVRCAFVRIGIVLDKRGGALAPMLTPFRLFVGGPMAGGKQWMSWIHHDDMTGILLLALDNPSATGAINATAPNPVTNRDFAKALGRAMHRPSFMPTPRFVLRTALGEVAEVITTGQRVLPRRAPAFGYTFKYPQIDAALAEIMGS